MAEHNLRFLDGRIRILEHRFLYIRRNNDGLRRTNHLSRVVREGIRVLYLSSVSTDFREFNRLF